MLTTTAAPASVDASRSRVFRGAYARSETTHCARFQRFEGDPADGAGACAVASRSLTAPPHPVFLATVAARLELVTVRVNQFSFLVDLTSTRVDNGTF